ncbi:MAG: hypothetical protein JWR80_3184 [Bradyrhizobium sp.]|nr:hypothetical protein [Bradyrhizobium sp.]
MQRTATKSWIIGGVVLVVILNVIRIVAVALDY